MYSKNASLWELSHKFSLLGEGVNAIAFSPDSFGLNIGCLTTSVNVFCFEESKQEWNKISIAETHKSPLISLKWCPSASSAKQVSNPLLVTGGEDGYIRVVEIELTRSTGRVLFELQHGPASVLSVDINVDLEIISCDMNTCILWQQNADDGFLSGSKRKVLSTSSNFDYCSASFNLLGTAATICSKNKTGKSKVYRRTSQNHWLELSSLT